MSSSSPPPKLTPNVTVCQVLRQELHLASGLPHFPLATNLRGAHAICNPHLPDEVMEARKRTSPQPVVEPLKAVSSRGVPKVAEGEAMHGRDTEMRDSPSSPAPAHPGGHFPCAGGERLGCPEGRTSALCFTGSLPALLYPALYLWNIIKVD